MIPQITTMAATNSMTMPAMPANARSCPAGLIGGSVIGGVYTPHDGIGGYPTDGAWYAGGEGLPRLSPQLWQNPAFSSNVAPQLGHGACSITKTPR
jgi:hypothetical protein